MCWCTPGIRTPWCGKKDCNPKFNLSENAKTLIADKRPQLGSWAAGDYHNICINCKKSFIGDKRALNCAACAYDDDNLRYPEYSFDRFEYRTDKFGGYFYDVCMSCKLDLEKVLEHLNDYDTKSEQLSYYKLKFGDLGAKNVKR